jgi:signal transduction histidine kinase
VIANLLSNAIKFTPRGKRIELRVEEEGGTVVLAVADQGIGMKSEWLDAPDTKTESRPGTEGEPGTGFGLLQVRQYVRAFGGRVEMTSHQLRGTTFRILLRKAV